MASYPALAQVWCWTSHESTGSEVRDVEREWSISTYCATQLERESTDKPRGLTPRQLTPGKHAGGGDEGGAGACAIVEGIVRSQDWCALYQPTEDLAEFPHPDPLGTDGQQKPPTRR